MYEKRLKKREKWEQNKELQVETKQYFIDLIHPVLLVLKSK